jgi:putative ABC transport system permease protein
MSPLAEIREGLGISWSAIRANKLRSVLATLGIVIGIVTVTLMSAAVEGLNRAFVKTVSFIGADVLYVEKTDWGNHSYAEWIKLQKRHELTLEQAGELEKTLTMARAVTPVDFTEKSIKYGKHSATGVTIIGSTDQLLVTGGIGISSGRFLSAADSDGGRPVCVIGSDVATNLFPHESPIGKRVAIALQPCEVVGVLDKQGSMFGDFDNQAIVPLPYFINAFENTRNIDQIQIKVKSVADVDDAREELRSVMRRLRRLAPGDPDDFAINQQNQILEMIHRVTGTMASVGLFITGLSLFTGGIGIMNIMFVSVAERTREIGVRKAIGARRRTILLQFLIEAASICLMGGLIGLGIACPLIWAVQRFFPAAISTSVVAIALLASGVTGILSGLFPAWRAARMNPVDALRNE